jgi:hypothetical protein
METQHNGPSDENQDENLTQDQKLARKPGKMLALLWGMIIAGVTAHYMTNFVVPVIVLGMIAFPVYWIRLVFHANPGLSLTMRRVFIISSAISAVVGLSLFAWDSPLGSSANQPPGRNYNTPQSQPQPTSTASSTGIVGEGAGQPTLEVPADMATTMSAEKRLALWAQMVPVHDYPNVTIDSTNEQWREWVDGLIHDAVTSYSRYSDAFTYTGRYTGKAWLSYGAISDPIHNDLAVVPKVGTWDTDTWSEVSNFTSTGAQDQWTGSPGDKHRELKGSIHFGLTGNNGNSRDARIEFDFVEVGGRNLVQVSVL